MTPRLRVDENFPGPSLALLRQAGYDVLAVAEDMAGSADSDVLAAAVREQRWLVTFDLDYGELIYVRGLPSPHCIVLLRLEHYRPEEPGSLLVRLLSGPVALEGHLVVMDADGLRLRPLPSSQSNSRK